MRVTSAGAGHDDRGDRRVVSERTCDRAQQQEFEHAVPARADHEEIGTSTGGAQHSARVSRQHRRLDRRVPRHVVEHRCNAVLEFAPRGVLGPSLRGTEDFAGNRLVGERPHHGHPSGPAKVPERPAERVSGVRGSVEADHDIQMIVERPHLRRDQRDGHRGVAYAVAAHRSDREIGPVSPSASSDHEQFRCGRRLDQAGPGPGLEHDTGIDEPRRMALQERSQLARRLAPVWFVAGVGRAGLTHHRTGHERGHRLDVADMICVIESPPQRDSGSTGAVDPDDHETS